METPACSPQTGWTRHRRGSERGISWQVHHPFEGLDMILREMMVDTQVGRNDIEPVGRSEHSLWRAHQ